MDIFCNALLYLPFFVSVFGAITLLFRWKKSSRPQHVWAVFLLILIPSTFSWGIIFSDMQYYAFYYKLYMLDITCMLLNFPLIFLYFRALTNPKLFTWRQYIWLAPGVAIGAVIAFLFLLMGEEQSI